MQLSGGLQDMLAAGLCRCHGGSDKAQRRRATDDDVARGRWHGKDRLSSPATNMNGQVACFPRLFGRGTMISCALMTQKKLSWIPLVIYPVISLCR